MNLFDYCCLRPFSHSRQITSFPQSLILAHDPRITCVCFCFWSQQQQQQRQQEHQQSSSAACRRRLDEEGEDRRRRHHRTTTAVVTTSNGGGRGSSTSCAANPEHSARGRTYCQDDLHAAEDDVRRRLQRGRFPAATRENVITVATDHPLGRRYGMYAATTAASATDARYGLRYGLSSSLAQQNPKTSSTAAAFFLRSVMV